MTNRPTATELADVLAIAEKLPQSTFPIFGNMNTGSPWYSRELAIALARACGGVAASLPTVLDSSLADWRGVDEAVAIGGKLSVPIGLYVLHRPGGVWHEFDKVWKLRALADRLKEAFGRGCIPSYVQLHIENVTKGTGLAWDGLTADDYTLVHRVTKEAFPGATVCFYDYPGPVIGWDGFAASKNHVADGTRADAHSFSAYNRDPAVIPWQVRQCKDRGALPLIPNITLTGALGAMYRETSAGVRLYTYAIDGWHRTIEEQYAYGRQLARFGVKAAFMWPDIIDYRVNMRRSLILLHTLIEGQRQAKPTWTNADLRDAAEAKP